MTLSAARDNILEPLHKAALGAAVAVLRACDQHRTTSSESMATQQEELKEETIEEGKIK